MLLILTADVKFDMYWLASIDVGVSCRSVVCVCEPCKSSSTNPDVVWEAISQSVDGGVYGCHLTNTMEQCGGDAVCG